MGTQRTQEQFLQKGCGAVTPDAEASRTSQGSGPQSCAYVFREWRAVPSKHKGHLSCVFKTHWTVGQELSAKKYSHNLKAGSYFIWWECLGLRVRESNSEKTAPRKQEGKIGYRQVFNKGSK